MNKLYKLFHLCMFTVPEAMIYLPISFSCYLLAKDLLIAQCQVRWEMGYGIIELERVR